MIDLLTAPIDELGLSPETLKALNKNPAAAGAYLGGRKAAVTVERLLIVVQSQMGRARLCTAIGRPAYAELIAELDDHGLIPERWGVGVEPAFSPLATTMLVGA